MDEMTQSMVDIRFRELVRSHATTTTRFGIGSIAVAASVLLIAAACVYALDTFVVRGLVRL
jgi:hypothetical protein